MPFGRWSLRRRLCGKHRIILHVILLIIFSKHRMWILFSLFFFLWLLVLYGPRREKTCLRRFAKKQRRRPACACAQSDQRLCYSLLRKYHMYTCYWWNFNFLTSLCNWGDKFETRFVGNPEDRFSRVEAHIILCLFFQILLLFFHAFLLFFQFLIIFFFLLLLIFPYQRIDNWS